MARIFTHAVIFKIKPQFVNAYLKDCRMWARKARDTRGFVDYKTLKMVDEKNQYASVYCWRDKKYHFKFMNAFHEILVKKSNAPVKVVGYYNLETIEEIK